LYVTGVTSNRVRVSPCSEGANLSGSLGQLRVIYQGKKVSSSAKLSGHFAEKSYDTTTPI